MSATRQRHMEATRAPRRRHVGAAVRGSPAVAGGERRRPNDRGWARWKEEVVGNLLEAAPLGYGHRNRVHGEPERRPTVRWCGRNEKEREKGNGEHLRARELTAVLGEESARPEEQRRRWNRARRGSAREEGDGGISLIQAIPASGIQRQGRAEHGGSDGGLRTARRGGKRRRRRITAAVGFRVPARYREREREREGR